MSSAIAALDKISKMIYTYCSDANYAARHVRRAYGGGSIVVNPDDVIRNRPEAVCFSYTELNKLYVRHLERATGNAEIAGDNFFKEIRRFEACILKSKLFRAECDIVDVYHMLLCGVPYENTETVKEVIEECRILKKGKYNKMLLKDDKALLMKHIKYIFEKWKVK